MKFEDDFLFAPSVNEAYVDAFGITVYWLNGSGAEHNQLMKMISDDKRRQMGWEKAVYQLACNEDGSLRYKGRVDVETFHTRVNHNWARTYGSLIMGLSEGEDETSVFEQEVEEGSKNSPASTATNS
jgi:hypothetical protein